MKKKLVTTMLITALTMSACSSAPSNVAENTPTQVAREISTENKTEDSEVTSTEAELETEIATELETEAATEYVEETEIAAEQEVTEPEFTITDLSATKYVKKQVNVRSLPNTDGEKLGSLNMNDEVKVTGQCNETNWYRIEFGGKEAYVSNNYLVDEKVVVAANEPAPVVDTVVNTGNTGNSTPSVENTVTTPSDSNAGDGAETVTPEPVVPETEAPAPAPELSTEAVPQPKPTPETEPTTEAVPQPEPTTESAPAPETSTEVVKNPNGYPEIMSKDIPTASPGTYYVVDTDSIVGVQPPIDMGQTSQLGGTIIDGDTGEIIYQNPDWKGQP